MLVVLRTLVLGVGEVAESATANNKTVAVENNLSGGVASILA